MDHFMENFLYGYLMWARTRQSRSNIFIWLQFCQQKQECWEVKLVNISEDSFIRSNRGKKKNFFNENNLAIFHKKSPKLNWLLESLDLEVTSSCKHMWSLLYTI